MKCDISIITLSDRVNRMKRLAADTECKLTPEESERFREEYVRILEKLEDHVAHTREKFKIV